MTLVKHMRLKNLLRLTISICYHEIFCPETFLFIFQNMHQGYPTETLGRFLKARDGNVAKAHKMVS